MHRKLVNSNIQYVHIGKKYDKHYFKHKGGPFKVYICLPGYLLSVLR